MGSKTTLDLTEFDFLNIFGKTTLRQMYNTPLTHTHTHTQTYAMTKKETKEIKKRQENLGPHTKHTHIYTTKHCIYAFQSL